MRTSNGADHFWLRSLLRRRTRSQVANSRSNAIGCVYTIYIIYDTETSLLLTCLSYAPDSVIAFLDHFEMCVLYESRSRPAPGVLLRIRVGSSYIWTVQFLNLSWSSQRPEPTELTTGWLCARGEQSLGRCLFRWSSTLPINLLASDWLMQVDENY